MLKALMGGQAPRRAAALGRGATLIVVAHDLSPADMILFKRHEFGGFVTDVGGVTSHTAIVARSLDIPALVGLHHARHMIREGELLIVDGTQGVLIVDPTRWCSPSTSCASRELELERQKLQAPARRRPRRRSTARRSSCYANIELPQDIERGARSGRAGRRACSAPSSCS